MEVLPPLTRQLSRSWFYAKRKWPFGGQGTVFLYSVETCYGDLGLASSLSALMPSSALPTISQPALPARKQRWDFFLNILKFRKAFYATTAITSFQGKHRNLAYFLGHAFCNTLYIFLRQNHGDNSDNSCIYPFSHLQSTSPRWVTALGTKEIAGKSERGRIGVICCSCASYFCSNNLWWYL